MSLLDFNRVFTDEMEIIDETTTLFVLFSLFLLTYYRANTPDDLLCRSLLGNVLNYLKPMLLIVFTFMFFTYENYKSKKKPLGIFQRKMFWKFIMAPFHTPTFREIYAADYLTSFTKIISDAVRAACFIFSGELLLHVGDTNTTWISSQANNIGIAAGVASMVPLLIDQTSSVLEDFVRNPPNSPFIQCYQIWDFHGSSHMGFVGWGYGW